MRKYTLTTLGLLICACGTQLVEFPDEQTSSGSSGVPDCECPVVDVSDSGSSHADLVDKFSRSMMVNDSGAVQDSHVDDVRTDTTGDSGGDSSSDTGGQGDGETHSDSGDSGSGQDSGSETDSGADSGSVTCGETTVSCEDAQNHGQCVSQCAHSCKTGHGKHHKSSCEVFKTCFKDCKAVCDCVKNACKKPE